MKVPVLHPTVSVTLYKTIKRAQLGSGAPVSQRFQGVGSKIDLTPFFAEGSNLHTTKSVRDAAGAFGLFFADRAHGSQELGMDSLYGLIEPMDMLELCFSRDVPSSGAKPPVVMRGFISSVRRVEGMGPDGRPVRGVMLSGQDYGKLWQMLQILYLPGYVVGQDTLTGFKLFERYGVGFRTSLSGVDFLRECMDKVLQPYLARLMPSSSLLPSTIELEIGDVQGTTSIAGPQNQEGTIHTLLQTYLDVGVWNELFLEDRDDAVYCVFRPNPFRNLEGRLIQPGAEAPRLVEVLAEDLVSLSVERSDANVANYYWVRAPRFDLNTDLYRKQFSVANDRDTVLLGGYQNSSEDLYGVRVMFVDTQMGGPEVDSFNSGLPEEQLRKRDDFQKDWIDERRRVLVEQNKDNVVFESGQARIKGNSNIRAGMEIRLRRGQFVADYYVPAVRHTFLPYQGFFTDLTLERGRGFIERAKREGGASSPYFAELSQ